LTKPAAYQDFFASWKDVDPDLPFLAYGKAEYSKLPLPELLARARLGSTSDPSCGSEPSLQL